MKTILSTEYRALVQTKARIIKLSKTKSVRTGNYVPFDTWLISIILLPAFITVLLLFKNSSSLWPLLQFYFSSLFFGIVLSLPIVLLSSFVFWLLTKIRCTLFVSRFVFLFVLIIATAIGLVFLPDMQVVGFSVPEVCLYTVPISVIISGISQVFKPK